MSRPITVYYNNGTSQTLVLDRDRGVRLEESEGYTIVRFGRMQNGEWIELLAAPLASVRSWGY